MFQIITDEATKSLTTVQSSFDKIGDMYSMNASYILVFTSHFSYNEVNCKPNS